MQWNLREVPNYRVHARDGDLGIVTDIYVDVLHWMVRYLGVTRSEKSESRRFMLVPEVISRIDREYGVIFLFLDTATIHDSPTITAGKNIPWREEIRLREYYGRPNYWPALSPSELNTQTYATGCPHLRSLEDVLGYRVSAGGEDIGSLTNLIIDDHTWKIHSLEVDAGGWLPADQAWVRTDCVKHVREAEQQITLTIGQDAVLLNPQPCRAALQLADGAAHGQAISGAPPKFRNTPRPHPLKTK